MLKVVLSYPEKEHEKLIIRQNIAKTAYPQPNKVVSPEDILKARAIVREIYLDEKIEQYIVDIVNATRYPERAGLNKLKGLINFGASPRASISLAIAGKALAFINRRGFVIPEDIRNIAHRILRHRIGLSYEAEAENMTSDEIITDILNSVAVP